ncbi:MULTISPECIES: pyrroline-5-carboxylate reductase [Methylobacterium]|uniref:Pyrroline-5-carboxylate reductase n=2 Tax=Pseudomonadota TaxID=1224 RepID=A0ABQ4SXJ9_9HYPH|nr:MULTISPECIES: pyrroline-5-carboxylate reductase [Methylobacterium]PIU07598.1 MAG: pyrroline-5-carboxylate reductase [Methylobacterium sp. CG09_land_8_20_14_0_10_71_15]PIU16224.1 MAG: pyrroline-5-carboxylate reductase [Methylobacterium sp. CG08_land_8_20_14_0_20_71_15]GBU19061.1 pyrroline-5-carboxylate reductase [Methylobacterium sp.]GJE07931.1 Pyrroline-5-carboxylate reductase [Methylobacterium jeotgali]
MSGSTDAGLPASLILVGAGKMGGAMLSGWLAGGLDPSRTGVIDPAPSAEIERLCAERGVALNPASPSAPEALVLAIKPQGLEAAAPALAPLAGSGTLVVSVLAGKTVANLQQRLPEAGAVVRAMPNLPASIGRGATGAFAGETVTGRQRAAAEALLSATGLVEWVADEALIDAVTALSGSGPAYVFLLAEAMAQAGIRSGLPPETAERLARATVAGAGALLDAGSEPAETLRRNVTSPGGTTAAALAVLMRENGLPALLDEAMNAARKRAAELAG